MHRFPDGAPFLLLAETPVLRLDALVKGNGIESLGTERRISLARVCSVCSYYHLVSLALNITLPHPALPPLPPRPAVW